LLLETDQLGSDLGQAVSARMAAARAVRTAAPLPRTFAVLVAQYPDQGWIALADETGTVIAGDGSFPEGTSVIAAPWFSSGRERPWIGIIESGADGVTGNRRSPLLGDLSMPLRDAAGHTLGVIATHLTWRWATPDLRRLSAGLEPAGSVETLILDADDRVMVGPKALLNRRWQGIPTGCWLRCRPIPARTLRIGRAARAGAVDRRGTAHLECAERRGDALGNVANRA
jgi:hypothetical protein